MKEIEHKPFKSLDFSHVDNKRHLVYGRVDLKRRQIQRIEAENFKLLKRIHDVPPTYDRKKLDKESYKQDYLMKKHCKYQNLAYQASEGSFYNDRSRSIFSNPSQTVQNRGKFPNIRNSIHNRSSSLEKHSKSPRQRNNRHNVSYDQIDKGFTANQMHYIARYNNHQAE